jgi:copper homeostasis protein (lipoprotein)
MKVLCGLMLVMALTACGEPKPEAAATPVATAPAAATPATAGRQMRGMYSYMADAGWYTDCLTGMRMPVAQDGDNAALEAAYSKAKQMDGAPLLAVVEGRVEDRLPMEGDARRPTLIVEKFISVEPQGCSGPQSTAQLVNTYWKLMTLDGASMESPAGAREIHFVLHSEGNRVAGFSGCNQMMGTYELDGSTITFSQMGGTLMACANGMEQEQKFHRLFPRVARWKIEGETLQLLDGNGAVVATFESRYMK